MRHAQILGTRLFLFEGDRNFFRKDSVPRAQAQMREGVTTMKKLILSFVLLMFTLPAAAQQEINQREADQQQRIDQGIKSGALTDKEATHLQNQEGRIDKQEGRMEAKDGGKLTAADKKKLNRELNRESRRIYREKHNKHVANP